MTKNDIHKIVHYVYHTKYRISVSQRDEISAMEKTTDWGKQWRRQKACCSSHQATYSRRLNFVLFSSARNCSVSLKRLLMGWRLRSKCKAFRLCWEKEKLLRSIRVVSQMNKTTSFFSFLIGEIFILCVCTSTGGCGILKRGKTSGSVDWQRWEQQIL